MHGFLDVNPANLILKKSYTLYINMRETKNAVLVLEDGTIFRGKSFGFCKSCSGEVVFNTAMTGYPESLTDPSCQGQILVSTFPLLGNYGVPPKSAVTNGLNDYFESDQIHCQAVVCQEYSDEYSHWLADKSLAEWLNEEKVVGICGIDTRALTKHLRENGTMSGKICIEENPDDVPFVDLNNQNLADKVSCKEVVTYGEGDKTVVLLDCGVQNSIIRYLLTRGVKVVRVPWSYDFSNMEYDGLFISNGPGNPDNLEEAVANIRKAMEQNKPVCGVALGNQLLAKAAGGKVSKLKYGHRSHNQPVRMVGTNSCFITTQSNGYTVDFSSLDENWEQSFVNLNDGTNEGIKHKTKPFYAIQFHPEVFSGSDKSDFILDNFIKNL